MCSVKKVFSKILQNLCQSLFLNKVSGPPTLIKKGLWHKRFPVKFAKFLRTTFFSNISARLFLYNDESCSATTCSKLTTETLEQGVKYAQS